MELDRNCKDCIYYGKSIGNCDYFEIEDELRVCPGGDKCTKKVTNRNKKKRPVKHIVIRVYPEKRKERDRQNHMIRMELYNAGYTDAEIAAKTGKSRKCISGWRAKHGLPPNQKRITNACDEQYGSILYELYSFGRTDREMSIAVGIDQKYVQEWRKYRGLEANRY